MSRKGSTFLKCEVRRGMFSDERVVIVRHADGETESFFVPESAVNEARSVVRVELHGEAQPGAVVARVPTDVGEAYVTVRPTDIES